MVDLGQGVDLRYSSSRYTKNILMRFGNDIHDVPQARKRKRSQAFPLSIVLEVSIVSKYLYCTCKYMENEFSRIKNQGDANFNSSFTEILKTNLTPVVSLHHPWCCIRIKHITDDSLSTYIFSMIIILYKEFSTVL